MPAVIDAGQAGSLPYDCLCAGIIVADHVCEPIERIPGPGELELTPRMHLTIGGCASNVAADLAKLGLKAAIAGTVGRDVFGRYVRQALSQAGVDCRYLTESATRETACTMIVNTRGEDRRFIHALGANQDFSGRELTPELIGSSRVLYLGGYGLCEELSAENVAAAFRTAREAGVVTVLDVVLPGGGDYWRLLQPVLPWTDVFLPNFDEAKLITGLSDCTRQAEAFHEAGARMAVVTCGGEGAVVVGESVRLQSGVYSVEFVDGTGSGDAFVAGFIYGLLRGSGVRDCLRYGSALGASCVRAAGATTGVLRADELLRFVEARELPIREV